MKADFVLDYDVIAAARAQHLYLLARIQAEAAPQSDSRRPLNLSVVLDRSGSMQGDKLAYVKQAAQFLVQRLGANDRLSIVSYDKQVVVEVKAGPVVHKDRITQAIQAIHSGGTTNLSGGWLQGCQLVSESAADGQVNRVLLLTDGLANEGVTEPVKLEAMTRQKRAEGITTTTMGVGMDFNEDLLTRMAAEGGGAFYFIDNPDQAPRIFSEELRDLLSVVGQNLVITITLSDEVRMVRQLNTYPTENHDGAVTFRLGDLFSDELKLLLLELSIPALPHLGQVEVAKLRFDYDELREDGVFHQTLELPIMVNTVPESDFAEQERNAEVMKTVLLLQAARAREEAIQHADRGDFKEASRSLADVADAIRESKIADPELSRQHDMLREESVNMDLGEQRYDSYTRKTFVTQSAYTQQFMRRAGESSALHTRHRMSQAAVERHAESPKLITWQEGSLPLTDHLTIGRALDNAIIIDEQEVSAHHCEIVRLGSDFILHDLNSTNGTFANGGRLAPLTDFRLSVGDVVAVGSRLFMFEGED